MPTPVSLERLLRAQERPPYPGLAHHDLYPSETPAADRALGLVMESLLRRLPDDERHAVELVHVASLSYREAAAEAGWTLSTGQPDPKRAWRLSRRGLGRLREGLAGGWEEALAAHRLPEHEGDHWHE